MTSTSYDRHTSTGAQPEKYGPYATSFPVAAPESAHWTDTVVTQGHADYCAAYGHATWTADGVVSQRCARCGDTLDAAFCAQAQADAEEHWSYATVRIEADGYVTAERETYPTQEARARALGPTGRSDAGAGSYWVAEEDAASQADTGARDLEDIIEECDAIEARFCACLLNDAPALDMAPHAADYAVANLEAVTRAQSDIEAWLEDACKDAPVRMGNGYWRPRTAEDTIYMRSAN